MSGVFRLLVSGSRDWTAGMNCNTGCGNGGGCGLTIARTLDRVAYTIAAQGFTHLTVVHGAARGADSIAARWATDRAARWGGRVTAEPHPVTDDDWRTHGKGAGHRRNRVMFDTGIDLLVAFCLNGSRGTTGAIDLAAARGVPADVHYRRTAAAILPDFDQADRDARDALAAAGIHTTEVKR